MHFIKVKGILSASNGMNYIAVVRMVVYIATHEASVITWNMILRTLKLKEMLSNY